MNRSFAKWNLLLVSLLIAMAPLCGAVRINEVVFDPAAGSNPDAEFIELYNSGPGSVDLLGWSLFVDTVLLKTFDASYTLAAGEYVAVYIGSPASPPPNSISLGNLTELLDDNGGELLLRDDTATPIDYIAYGTSVANPPAPLVFPAPVSLTYWQVGDSIAFIQPSGSDSDDSSQWINRRGGNVTAGALNTEQAEPTLSYGDIAVPAGFPIVDSCDQIILPIALNYSGETPVFDTGVSFTLPAGFLFVAANAGGTFTDGTRTVAWDIGTLTSNQSLEVRLRPDCSATGGEFEASDLSLSYRRFSNQTPPSTASATNAVAAFTVNAPDIAVAMGQYLSGDSVIITDIGTIVEFQIVVTNNGTGGLLGDGGQLVLTIASNLSLIGFRQNGPSGPPVANLVLDTANGIFTGSTGALAPTQSRLFYVKALTVGCAVSLGCAKAEVSWGCADADPGSQNCTVDTEGGASVFCPPSLAFEVPVGQPARYSGCQDVVRNIVISNPNGVPVELQDLSVNLPTGYYWVSSRIGASDVGTYNQVDKTLVFTGDELTGGTGIIAAYNSVTVELIMRPSCTAANDRKASGTLNYQIVCPLSGAHEASVSEQSAGIVLYQPALAVSVQDPDNPTKTTVLAERGETVTFKVVVINNGLGDLDTDGKPAGEEGGWLELGTIGTGLNLQTVFDITGGEPGVDQTPAGPELRWPTGVMPAGSEKTYLVNFLVVDCEDVAYEIETYWNCQGTHVDDSCRQDGDSKGSVNILLRNPSLNIEPTPFVVDYCNGVTVTIPVANAVGEGIGAARNVSVNMFGMNLSHYTLNNGAGSDFDVSVAGDVATFTLVNGQDTDGDGDDDDIGPGGTYNIVVDIAITADVCNAATGSLLIFQPYYEDSCAIPYTTGTKLASYSRTNPPPVAFSKSGPAVATVGDTGLAWSMTLTYVGTPETAFEYTLVDNYPDPVNNAFGNFTINSATPAGYVDNGDTITWTISALFDVDGEYTQTFTINFDAPDTVCAGGRTYTNSASVNIITPVDPVDCNNCEQPDSFIASSSITLNNNIEDDIDQHNRQVTYLNVNVHGLDNSTYQAAGETCTEMVFDQLMRFTAASPDAWTVDVDPDPVEEDIRPIRFRDDLNQRLRAPGGSKENLAIEIYYFAAAWQPGTPSGTNYGPTGTALVDWDAVTYVAPTVGDDGYLEIDLSGLDNISGAPENPSDQGILWIRYTVQSQEATAGTFTDFAKLIVPLEGADPCSLGEPETEYHHLATVTVADPVATVSISNMSSPDSRHIDRCETLTLRFNLGIEGGTPFDVYDARLVVDLGTNYKYISGSTAFGNGLKDEGGSDFTTFEPDQSGTTLIWNLGDLRDLAGAGGGRFIDVEVQKNCDESSTLVSATVYSNTQCNQVDDNNGPGEADSQDSAIAALSGFDNSSSGSYQPLLFSGRLETRFATDRVFYNDGYPSALFHIVNSGNGTLHNVRVPVVLGSVLNGTNTLTFVEAHVTAVSGVTSEVVDLINPVVPVVLGPEGLHGRREITFGVDWMAPSSIVTIRLSMRMVLCADLSLEIVQSHWGCPPGPDDACPSDLTVPELNSSMEILSGNTRALVIEHRATPSVIDLCGSLTRVNIEILNAGSVDVYEPSLRERLPEGMAIRPDSVQYSINGGALTPFPEAGGAGLRYSELTETVTGIGTYQTILWVFTDPNLDRDEADSLLTSPAFDDPYPSDPYFQRHKVMKPGTRIVIEFDAELSGCASAQAYNNSERKAEATILFDLPCQHDNRYNLDGSPAAGGYRAPLDDNTRDSNFLDPGIANLVIDLNGQNTTQSGSLTFSQVNAEVGDSVEWTVQIDSLGPGVVPEPSMDLFVPSILDVDFAVNPPLIISPANIEFVDSNPAGVAESNPDGTRYTFVFRNTDPDMIAAGREFYFAADEKVTVKIQSTVNTCVEENPTFEAIIRWGCCQGTPGLEAASGIDQSSTALKTRPDLPTIAITEGDGVLITEFDSCLGAYRITLTNPSTNRELSLWNMDVQMTLPAGWAYAPLAGDGTDFSYAGDGARLVPDQLSALEEEPVISGTLLRWTSVTRGGNIPDDKARLFPREQLVLTVYLRADGTGINCDLDGAADPSVPSFAQAVSLVNYEDSCGNSLAPPITASVNINPENPNLNISLLPNIRFIGSTTSEVLWELRVQNAGDKTAENITLEITFADGYSVVVHTGGVPAPAQTGGNFTWALGTIASIDAGDTLLWTFTGTIDTVNRDDLSAEAVVRGYCLERDASTGCTYSFDETEQFVSGGAISKVLDGTRLQPPAVSTIPGANDPAATAAEVTIGTIIRHLLTVELYEGGDTDVIIRDVLPAGLQFLEANLIGHAGNLLSNLVPTSTSGNIITFSHSSIPQFAGISGGRLGTNAIFLEIWVRVVDNTSVNVEGGTLENVAQLTIIRGNQTFDHTTPDITLFESNTLTILEPFIRNDADLAKLSDPLSLPSNHVGPVLDIEARPAGDNPVIYTFTAKNTGTSPAYELEFTDLFPWQLEDPTLLLAPYELTVEITPAAGPPARTLVRNTDYTLSWTAGVSPNPGTLKVNLLSTAAAVLGVDEMITFTYYGKVETFAPGTFVDNSAAITGYSSLPEDGATLLTANTTNLLEEDDERSSYGDAYRSTPNKLTYHKFTEELIAYGSIIAEITPLADDTPPDFRDDGSTRAAIGEQIEYWLRLSLPQLITLHDLAFAVDVPDGLTVRSAKWEIVLAGNDFSGAEKTLSFAELGSGLTEVRGLADGGADDFPQPFSNNTGNDQEMLVKVLFTVDRTYSTGGGAVLAGNAFNLPATFSWSTGSDSTDPIPALTVVDPKLTSLTKARTAHFEADNVTPAVSPGSGTYRNYNLIGPDNAGSPTDPVTNVYQVRPTDIVEFTITFRNQGDATAWNIQLRDTIPDGMTLRPGSRTIVTDPVDANIAISDPAPASVVTFDINRVLPGHDVTVTYRCDIDADVAVGRYLQNQVDIVQYSSLPEAPFNAPIMPEVAWPDADRSVTSGAPDQYGALGPVFEKAGTEFPITSKTVESELTVPAGQLKDGSSRASIGERMTYEIRLDIPDTAVLNDLEFSDIVADGLTVRSAVYRINAGAPVNLDMAVNPDGTTTVTAATNPFGDVAGLAGVIDEIVVTITVTVDQTFISATGATDNGPFGVGGANGIVDAGDSFANNATFVWNQVDGVATSNTQDAEPVPVSFTILEPLLETLTKEKAAVAPAAFGGPADGYRNYNTVGPNPDNAGPVDGVDQVVPGHIVLYTVTFVNNGDTIAYDIDLADEIPEGMSYVPGSATITAGPNLTTIAFRSVPAAPVLPSRTLEFEVNYLEPGNVATLKYQLQVDTPVGAGRFLLNQINLVDYRSLPVTAAYPDAARNTDAPAPNYSQLGPALAYIGTSFPSATKTVESELSLPTGKLADGSARGTIGEVMTYELLIDIPDDTVLYDVLIEDVIPANLTVRTQNLVPADITYAVVNNNGTLTTYGSADPQLSITGNTVALYLESDVRAQNGVLNEIRVVIAVTVDDVAANVAGTVFENNVTTSWNQVDEDPGGAAGRTTLNGFITPDPAASPDSVDFTVIEPAFATTTLTKTRSAHYLSDGVSGAVSPGTATYRNYNPAGPNSHLTALDPVPDVYQVRPTEILEYTVTFVNSGDARAYDIRLTDAVPGGFTLLTTGVNAPSISGGTTVGIAFINSTPAQPGGSGTSINLVVNWLDPGQTCTITFRAQVEPGIGAGAYLQNQLSMTDFGTTPDATAVFPDLERDSSSTVPYVVPNPKFEKAGSEYPVTSKTIQTELSAPSGKLKDGSSRATIGELLTYEILLDIKDDLVLFDLNVADLLPDGLTAVAATYSIAAGAPVAMTIAAQGNGTTLVSDAATPLGDVAAVAALTNEIVITITATVDQTFVSATGATDNGPFGVGGANGIVDAGDVPGNNATFTWNQVNDEATESTQDAEPAPVTFTVVEPNLDGSFEKFIIDIFDSDGSSVVTTSRGHSGAVSVNIPAAVNGRTSYFRYPAGGGNPTQIDDVQVVLPDDYVEYQISIENSGTAPAFDIRIRDILPPLAEVSYSSGTGTFAVAAVPYTSGTAGSLLGVVSSVVNIAGIDHTRLDFTIDLLAAGDTAVITYRAQVNQGLGAGHYIGPNEAMLNDFGSLPDGTFTIPVGNLAAGDSVFDNDRERDATSTPAYATQGPEGDDIGVQYPEFLTRVYLRYDDEGQLTDTLLTGFTNLRIGDILIYEQEAVLPRYTTLFDGGGNALAYRNRLNRGYHVITGSEQFAFGDIDLTGLHKAGSPNTPYDVIGEHQYPTWLFDDIANTTGSSQTAILRFQAEVKTTEYNGASYFTDQTATYNLVNQAYLFWNTTDSAEKDTLQYWTGINAGDHPFLLRDSQVTGVVQPNLELIKTANPVDGSFIGVSSGAGDLVTYTLILRNWNSSSAGTYQGRNTAYNVLLSDVLPKDLAPVAPSEPILTAAVHALNSGTGEVAALSRTLARNDDYNYNYIFDPVSGQGTITFETIGDGGNSDYDSRIEANAALVITYQVNVNPDIGAQGSGAGKRVNQALINDYYSFPENINDLVRKQYGPEGPRRVSILTEVPAVDKTSPTAGDSVVPGNIIEYTLVAPKDIIRANLYEVEFRDSIPDGLTFGGDGVFAGVGPGPVSLNIGDGIGQVPGDEVVVTGGSGAVTITVSGRNLVVAVERIDAEGGEDQVTITLRVLVQGSFDNGAPVARLHEFSNIASLLWYDDDGTFADRSRYATMSPAVSHFFDARGILFEPSHTGTAQPGTIRVYRHMLRNFEDQPVSIPLVFSSTQTSWIWQLFVGDGEGNMISGPFESGYSVDVPANDVTEVIMRTFVPTEITSLTTDVLTIMANGAMDNIITVTDVTVVQVERIAVFKDISTTGDYATRLNVNPDQANAINQRIRFFNNGPQDVKEIYVYDFIPENTAYIANSAVNTAEFGLQYSKDGGVTWLAGEPADNGESVLNGTVPAVTNLRWYYDAGGILVPGVEKSITFQIRIK